MTVIRQLEHPGLQLAQIHARCFDEPWSEGVFADLLIKPHHRTYVYERDGQIKSFVVMAVVGGEGEILTLATDPDFQNQGLAHGLMAQVIQSLKDEGAVSLFLEVAIDNAPALKLYTACGFARVGRRRAYYSRPSGPPVDAFTLRLALTSTEP
ncbi:MAG: ribosomal protein S18-alanine N-acetyltransferase [Asticcacaulis sp.]